MTTEPRVLLRDYPQPSATDSPRSPSAGHHRRNIRAASTSTTPLTAHSTPLNTSAQLSSHSRCSVDHLTHFGTPSVARHTERFPTTHRRVIPRSEILRTQPITLGSKPWSCRAASRLRAGRGSQHPFARGEITPVDRSVRPPGQTRIATPSTARTPRSPTLAASGLQAGAGAQKDPRRCRTLPPTTAVCLRTSMAFRCRALARAAAFDEPRPLRISAVVRDAVVPMSD